MGSITGGAYNRKYTNHVFGGFRKDFEISSGTLYFVGMRRGRESQTYSGSHGQPISVRGSLQALRETPNFRVD